MPVKIDLALRLAYLGRYEDVLHHEYIRAKIAHDESQAGLEEVRVFEPYEDWAANWVETKILSDSIRDRLETFLQWEGIIGYTDTILRIAQGGIGTIE